MGPPLFSDGEGFALRTLRSSRPSLNGAAALQRRRVSLASFLDRSSLSSQWGRRSSATERGRPCSHMATSWRLNGAAALQRRRVARPACGHRQIPRSQWGRRSSATEGEYAERCIKFRTAGLNGAAALQRRRGMVYLEIRTLALVVSMGPPLFSDGGPGEGLWQVLHGCCVSMGPPLFSDGGIMQQAVVFGHFTCLNGAAALQRRRELPQEPNHPSNLQPALRAPPARPPILHRPLGTKALPLLTFTNVFKELRDCERLPGFRRHRRARKAENASTVQWRPGPERYRVALGRKYYHPFVPRRAPTR